MKVASFETIARALDQAGARTTGMIFSTCDGFSRTRRTMAARREIDWQLTTWEGSRRATLRRWSRFTLREKFEAVQEMAELSERLHGRERFDALRRLRRRPASR